MANKDNSPSLTDWALRAHHLEQELEKCEDTLYKVKERLKDLRQLQKEKGEAWTWNPPQDYVLNALLCDLEQILHYYEGD